jgi:hypothetical protein
MLGLDPCARCGDPSEVVAYWNDPLCRRCARKAAAYFDNVGRWPKLPAVDQASLEQFGTATGRDE